MSLWKTGRSNGIQSRRILRISLPVIQHAMSFCKNLDSTYTYMFIISLWRGYEEFCIQHMYIHRETCDINVNQKENLATTFINVLETKSYLIVIRDKSAVIWSLEYFLTKMTKNGSFWWKNKQSNMQRDSKLKFQLHSWQQKHVSLQI